MKQHYHSAEQRRQAWTGVQILIGQIVEHEYQGKSHEKACQLLYAALESQIKMLTFNRKESDL